MFYYFQIIKLVAITTFLCLERLSRSNKRLVYNILNYYGWSSKEQNDLCHKFGMHLIKQKINIKV